MAGVSEKILERVRRIGDPLCRHGSVVATYVFGSQAWGIPDEESDVDVAAFLEGAEGWDLRKRASVVAEVQRALGDDIELHLFSASVLRSPPLASLAKLIVEKGIRVV
jgi:predicted nucleotidyltransferase